MKQSNNTNMNNTHIDQYLVRCPLRRVCLRARVFVCVRMHTCVCVCVCVCALGECACYIGCTLIQHLRSPHVTKTHKAHDSRC